METEIIKIDVPENCNIILGQTHFIKTIEDLYEAISETVPGAKFGIGFCEASGKRLVRKSGNDDDLIKKASEKSLEIGAGHIFLIYIKDCYPINILNKIKNVSEVCNIYCATANPVQVLVAKTEQGRGIIGVVDGSSPTGIEKEEDIRERKEFLRKIGYKL